MDSQRIQPLTSISLEPASMLHMKVFDLSTRTTSWSTMCRHTARNRQPVGYVGLRFLGPFIGFNGIYSQLTLFWIILGVSEMRCTPKWIWVKRCKFRWAGSTPDGHYGRVLVGHMILNMHSLFGSFFLLVTLRFEIAIYDTRSKMI